MYDVVDHVLKTPVLQYVMILFSSKTAETPTGLNSVLAYQYIH